MIRIGIIALSSVFVSCCMPHARYSKDEPSTKSDTAYVILPPVNNLNSETGAPLETHLLRYNTDLAACQRKVSAIMGDAARDDVDALRRQLRTIDLQSTVTLRLPEQDLATTRYAAVKTCLFERGYRAGD